MFSARKLCATVATGVFRQFVRQGVNVRLGSTYRAAILTEFNKIPTIERVKVQQELFPGQVRFPDNLTQYKNYNSLMVFKVKVDVKFCSLNYTDVRILEGGENVELPLVPGCEFSGEIVAIDPDNKLDFKVGDRIVALRGTEGGGLASEVILNEFDCFPLGNIPLKDAAILPYGHGTAMLAFSKYCPLDGTYFFYRRKLSQTPNI